MLKSLTDWCLDDVTELDLSDFDTMESQEPINDLSVFVRDFKPTDGSFSFPQRLARLDLPDMSYGISSQMSSSITDLFECLKQFNVTQIMRLYAKDHTKEPVDDDSIALWVSKFKVEYLDWRKLDMDIGPLAKNAHEASSCLKTITLYNSGHWGVLYHWLSLDGLFSILGV